MYPSITPYHGGSARIYNIYHVCSESFTIEFLAESFTLRALFKPHDNVASADYREHVRTDVLSLATYAISRLMRVPQLLQSDVYRLTIPRWARAAARTAAVIVVEQPWQFRWAARNRGPSTKIVYDAHNVEARMFDSRLIRGPRFIAEALSKSIVRQEKAAVRSADRVFATSPEDAEILGRDYGAASDRVSVIPNGVDAALIKPASTVEREHAKTTLSLSGKHVVLFVGSKHGPNRAAVDFILAWAAAETNANLHFLIAGSVGSWFPGVTAANITITGFVDDVRQFIAAADVAINPMSSGGGTNLKQIEYLAAGLPSVTTPIGARGLGVTDNVHCLIRELADMAFAVTQLRNDPDRARQLASAGRALVESRFDWRVIGERAAAEFRATIARGTAGETHRPRAAA